ncbi:2,3-bisphosphoglycerate-dependent phosphoglycerate mutase [Pseudorhodoferax sp.]|uniref:2,3-bisphosphoglycerate-dependent phosphoglycerate mutase n=1 Tax=Pseudorhodoferax sp. TaxID=1993553 RepID=UPI002DD62A1E|nr:2,3-bisphosphoglycerate-dependent phosphoglycerate mutase [Pseudorhodoferax sp.]
MRQLVLVRHGESEWNRTQRFTGWADVGLTAAGQAQMRAAAVALRQAGIGIDAAFCSVLRRCTASQWILLDTLERTWVPQLADWRLNERHYGGLTGRSKAQAEREHGLAAVQRWRRSYDAVPPPMDARATACVPIDGRYAGLAAAQIPAGESLQQTVARVDQVWRQRIAPMLATHATVAVVGHGNSLRALMKTVECLSDDAIASVEVANAEPVVYAFDAAGRLLCKRRLQAGSARPSEIL